jgi:hypothetical protein
LLDNELVAMMKLFTSNTDTVDAFLAFKERVFKPYGSIKYKKIYFLVVL